MLNTNYAIIIYYNHKIKTLNIKYVANHASGENKANTPTCASLDYQVCENSN